MADGTTTTRTLESAIVPISRASTAFAHAMLWYAWHDVEPFVETPPAAPSDASSYFESPLAFETDCWDVHEAMESTEPGFVLLDVRSPELFTTGHLPGAVNLPHRRINERNLAQYESEVLFVVYCAGPHCNGADKAAARIARLNRPVKKMIGGVEGWKDESFDLVIG